MFVVCVERYFLALLYEYGLGVEQDDVKAVEWSVPHVVQAPACWRVALVAFDQEPCAVHARGQRVLIVACSFAAINDAALKHPPARLEPWPQYEIGSKMLV